jgi:hypothetical protein
MASYLFLVSNFKVSGVRATGLKVLEFQGYTDAAVI